MWLLVSLAASIAATGSYFVQRKRYRLGMLSVLFWGLTLMIFIDHILGYEGGPFLETKTDGSVPNPILLGLLMILPVMTIWTVSLIIDRIRSIPKTR